MKRMKPLPHCCVACLLALSLAGAARASDGPEQVLLRVDPAPAPTPFLKYSLYPEAADRREGNAVPLYYRGLLHMEITLRYGEDDPAQRMNDWLFMPVDELPRDEVRAVVDRFRSTLREIEVGARRTRCEWDIPFDIEGIDTRLDDLQQCRQVSRVLSLKARLEIAERRYGDAATTLQTGFSLAHDVARSGSIVGMLVGIACHNHMLDAVEQFIQAPGAPNLYWALARLPSYRPALEDMEFDPYWLFVEVPYIRDIETRVLSQYDVGVMLPKLAEVLRSLDESATGGPLNFLAHALQHYSSAKEALLASGRAPEQIEAMTGSQVVLLAAVLRYREDADRARAYLSLSHAERREMPDIDRAGEDQYYPFTIAFPAVQALGDALARRQHNTAILQLVEAVRMYAAVPNNGLPSTLDDLAGLAPAPLDPFTREPFHYRLEDGAALIQASTGMYDHLRRHFEIRITGK